MVFEPLDFIARLAALVPRPRAHLTRYHGVFAPHSRWRAEVTPAGRGKPKATDLRTPAERHLTMSWAQRLKRVFGIEIETCEMCGGKVRVMASIEDPAVIGRILRHRASQELPAGSRRRRGVRLRGSWGFRNGVGCRGAGGVHDAGGSPLHLTECPENSGKLKLPLPTADSLDIWCDMTKLAKRFWESVGSHELISREFAAIANRNAEIVE